MDAWKYLIYFSYIVFLILRSTLEINLYGISAQPCIILNILYIFHCQNFPAIKHRQTLPVY